MHEAKLRMEKGKHSKISVYVPRCMKSEYLMQQKRVRQEIFLLFIQKSLWLCKAGLDMGACPIAPGK